MKSTRRTAVVAGVFFIVAAAAAIIGYALESPVLTDTHYIVGPGVDTQVILGAFFEVIAAASIIGTAVTLFPIVKRQNESIALAYVAGRTLEAVVIVAGIISLLSVVRLRQGYAGATGVDAASLVAIGKSLIAIHDWTFLFGPSLAIGVNTLMLAYLMYTSRLVPLVIPIIGLVGGPLLFVSGIAEMFGLYGPFSAWGSIGALPVFAWEMSLAFWMIIKGFKPSLVTSDNSQPAAVSAQ